MERHEHARAGEQRTLVATTLRELLPADALARRRGRTNAALVHGARREGWLAISVELLDGHAHHRLRDLVFSEDCGIHATVADQARPLLLAVRAGNDR